MTDSMVERVARVIIAGFDEVTEPEEREDCLNLARAAIAAMREPTEAMVEAGETFVEYSASACWDRMIDEALK